MTQARAGLWDGAVRRRRLLLPAGVRRLVWCSRSPLRTSLLQQKQRRRVLRLLAPRQTGFSVVAKGATGTRQREDQRSNGKGRGVFVYFTCDVGALALTVSRI